MAVHLRFDQFERIGWHRTVSVAPLFCDCGFVLKYAINFARIRTEEEKAANAFATDNGFEKKGRFVPNLGVSSERCLAVSRKIQINRYGVTFSSQCQFGSVRLNVHRIDMNFDRRILNVESIFRFCSSLLVPDFE